MLGFNYRLTDIQAALGSSQLSRIDHYLERRIALAQRYDGALSEMPLQRPLLAIRSAFHLYVVRLRRAGAGGKPRKYLKNCDGQASAWGCTTCRCTCILIIAGSVFYRASIPRRKPMVRPRSRCRYIRRCQTGSRTTS